MLSTWRRPQMVVLVTYTSYCYFIIIEKIKNKFVFEKKNEVRRLRYHL